MLTPADILRQSADELHAIAQKVVDFRLNHPELDETDKGTLQTLAIQLLSSSNTLYNQAAQSDLSSITPQLDAIAQGNQRLQQQLDQMNRIASIIHVASAAVTLGVAVTSGSVFQIASALKNIDQLTATA